MMRYKIKLRNGIVALFIGIWLSGASFAASAGSTSIIPVLKELGKAAALSFAEDTSKAIVEYFSEKINEWAKNEKGASSDSIEGGKIVSSGDGEARQWAFREGVYSSKEIEAILDEMETLDGGRGQFGKVISGNNIGDVYGSQNITKSKCAAQAQGESSVIINCN